MVTDLSIGAAIASLVFAFVVAVVARRRRTAAAAELEESELRYLRMVQRAPDLMYRIRLDPVRYDFLSDNFERIFGMPADALVKDPAAGRQLLDPPDQPSITDVVTGSATDVEKPIRTRYRRPDGQIVWLEHRLTTIEDPDGVPVAVEGIGRDVTELKIAEEQLALRAERDPLTALPNRTSFFDSAQRAASECQRYGTRFGVLLFDVDRFKHVNDSLGHVAGDSLLVMIAQRAQHVLRPSDVIARFGGDEFVVLVTNLDESYGLVAVARRILDAVAQPITLDGHTFRPGISIGIASGCEPGRVVHDVHDVLRRADAALYAAKARGRGRYELFDEALAEVIDRRLRTEVELQQALERDEFELHYQPEVTLATGEICGVEALLRWRHPTRGLLGPADFLPIAEEVGLISQIGQWVFEHACRQQRRWAEDTDTPLDVSINLSPVQLGQPGLASGLLQTVHRTGADPARLCVEVTETALVKDPEGAARQLLALRRAGVRIAVDDFGTGYSSLTHLKRLPIDTLKIDTTFVEGVDIASDDKAIVTAIINLAAALDLDVIAEGVETIGQSLALQRLGCTTAQGYLFARPQPAEHITLQLARA